MARSAIVASLAGALAIAGAGTASALEAQAGRGEASGLVGVSAIVQPEEGLRITDDGEFAGTLGTVPVAVSRRHVGATEIITVVPQ
jgi:hypothetical protein